MSGYGSASPSGDEVYVVSSEVEQLALPGIHEGDTVVRSDENEHYIAKNSNNASMSDWQILPGGGTILASSVTNDSSADGATIKDAFDLLTGGLPLHRTSRTLDDDEQIISNSYTSGVGSISVGEEEWANFSWNSSGSVFLKENSENVINSDIDGFFCIFKSGTTVYFRNRLGNSKVVMLELKYHIP